MGFNVSPKHDISKPDAAGPTSFGHAQLKGVVNNDITE
jgi:hypothetical protein